LPAPRAQSPRLRSESPLEIDESATVRGRRGRLQNERSHVTVEDLRRRSQEHRVRSQSSLGLIAGVGLLIATYLVFIVASAPLVEQGTPARVIVGFLPLAAACVWAAFDNVPIHHAGWIRRSLVPVARHTAEILLVLLFVYAFVAHRMATQIFADESAWFFAYLPDNAVLAALENLTMRMGQALSGIYAVIGRTLPW
jgi:small-conductance mechanosensitive channel